jgi:hypothetical protein
MNTVFQRRRSVSISTMIIEPSHEIGSLDPVDASKPSYMAGWEGKLPLPSVGVGDMPARQIGDRAMAAGYFSKRGAIVCRTLLG